MGFCFALRERASGCSQPRRSEIVLSDSEQARCPHYRCAMKADGVVPQVRQPLITWTTNEFLPASAPEWSAPAWSFRSVAGLVDAGEPAAYLAAAGEPHEAIRLSGQTR